MAKQFFNIEEKSKTEVNIMIFGIIGVSNSYWSEGTDNTAYSFVTKFRALDKKYERINIYINSPGGFIEDGLAIFNTIRNAKAEVHTYNNGLTASMASVIMLAGKHRHFPTTSMFHLHSASMGIIGNAVELQEGAQQLNKFDDVLIKAIAEQSGLETSQIKADWFDGKDYYFTGEESKKYGFATEVTKETTDVPEDIKNLKYSKLLNFYKETQKKPKNKKSFIQKIFNTKTITNQNPKKNIIMENYKLLIALILVDALNTENDKIVLEKAQVNKVENELERLYKVEEKYFEQKKVADTLAKSQEEGKKTIDELTEKIALSATEQKTNKKTIDELNAKLDKKPAKEDTNVKDESIKKNTDADWETINNLPHNIEFDKYN